MLAEEVKELEEAYRILVKQRAELLKEIEQLKCKSERYKACCEMIIPEKVYTHKTRRNTTVKFRDGSSMTVTRKQGEKDCLETAIAYCLLKQILTAADIKALINNKEEH